MELPIEIIATNFTLPGDIEENIRQKVHKLEQVFDRITRCRVVIETAGRHHRKGNDVEVKIDIIVPGAELVVNRQAHPELPTAIKKAFDAAKRQLEDYSRKRRGAVKAHDPPPQAKVERLFPDGGYGFLRTSDGREIYFHENSVLNNGFHHLEIGSEVRFVEEQGDEGPQASTVTPI